MRLKRLQTRDDHRSRLKLGQSLMGLSAEKLRLLSGKRLLASQTEWW
jgi:hypothetical protein